MAKAMLWAFVLLAAIPAAADIMGAGELAARINANFDRLEAAAYRPPDFFAPSSNSDGWPGDHEGRTLLGLVSLAKVSGREPKYLEDILRQWPEHLNEKGYFGPLGAGEADEQRLSGHGWALRGLCEYYLWSKDKQVLPWIRAIADNVFLAVAGRFKDYPINPGERPRDVGEAAGSRLDRLVRGWRLSTDVGCFMIGIDGLVQASQVLNDHRYDQAVETAFSRFLEMDVVALKAQTHATLTGLRALLRYDGKRYLQDVQRIWNLYRRFGMTEYFGNYNWFARYATWCEPCAIVDSHLVALQLWELTGDTAYLEDAERIYWNALCREQHHNGGFGLDNTPGLAAATNDLAVACEEAYWCCTMRGAEGLFSAADFAVRVKDDALVFAEYHACKATLTTSVGRVSLTVDTDYPFDGCIRVTLSEVPSAPIALRFFVPSYARTKEPAVNGLVEQKRVFKAGEQIEFKLELSRYDLPAQCPDNAAPTARRRMLGPLLLGVDENGVERPVYHLLDPAVWAKGSGRLTILHDASSAVFGVIFKLTLVVGLLAFAAFLATPRGRLPLALRGLQRLLRRDRGESAVRLADAGERVSVGRRLLALLLVLLALGMALTFC